MSSASSKVIRNITSNWLGLFINIVVSFFLAPFVVNKLGANMYGIWAVAMQFTGYIYLMDFGVRDALIRYTAKYQAVKNVLGLRRILSAALIIYFPVFLVAMLVTFIIAYTFPRWATIPEGEAYAAQVTVFLVGSSIASTFLFNIFTGLLQGMQRFDISNVIGVSVGLLRAGAIVLVLGRGGGILALAWIQFSFAMFSGVISFIAAIYITRRAGISIRPVMIRGKRLQALLRLVSGYSLYVFINNIGQKLALATDALVISVFMPISSVTYYAIAGNLIGYYWTLVSATAQVFNPVASQLSALKDNDGLRTLLLRSTRLTLFIALPVICAYIILGNIFISLWMGPDFSGPASSVLVVLALAQILACPHVSIASILYGIGRHKSLAFLRLAEGLINVLLSIVLVQKIGILGVAIGTAIPHTIIFGFIVPLYVCKILNVPWKYYVRKSLLGPFINAIPFVVCAWWIRVSYEPAGLIGFFMIVGGLSLLYMATGYILCLEHDERKYVRNYARRYFLRVHE